MKKKFLQIFTFGIFFIAVIIGFAVNQNKRTSNASSKSIAFNNKVIIDAGHGGFDGGAVSLDGTKEKDINLKIAKKLKSFLVFNGYKVIMTREDDKAINDSGQKIRSKKVSDMQNRLLLMKENPDAIFVSIHLNKYTTSAAFGAQVFYSDNFSASKDLAQKIKESIKTLLEPYNNREIKKGNSSSYLLYNARIPCVLVECGFLSNKQDLSQLKNDEFQNKMAFAISKGILDFN